MGHPRSLKREFELLTMLEVLVLIEEMFDAAMRTDFMWSLAAQQDTSNTAFLDGWKITYSHGKRAHQCLGRIARRKTIGSF
jgi:hypothetical protein